MYKSYGGKHFVDLEEEYIQELLRELELNSRPISASRKSLSCSLTLSPINKPLPIPAPVVLPKRLAKQLGPPSPVHRSPSKKNPNYADTALTLQHNPHVLHAGRTIKPDPKKPENPVDQKASNSPTKESEKDHKKNENRDNKDNKKNIPTSTSQTNLDRPDESTSNFYDRLAQELTEFLHHRKEAKDKEPLHWLLATQILRKPRRGSKEDDEHDEMDDDYINDSIRHLRKMRQETHKSKEFWSKTAVTTKMDLLEILREKREELMEYRKRLHEENSKRLRIARSNNLSLSPRSYVASSPRRHPHSLSNTPTIVPSLFSPRNISPRNRTKIGRLSSLSSARSARSTISPRSLSPQALSPSSLRAPTLSN